MNGPVLFSYILTVLLLKSVVNSPAIENNNNEFDECYTPNEEQGICIEVRKCTKLVNKLMQERPLTSENINYLKRAHCGFEGLFPKICCAEYHDNNKESPTITQMESNDVLPNTNICGLHEYLTVRGSVNAGINEFPWLALLQYTKPSGRGFHCGGSLISKKYVLTAAHCVKRMPKSWILTSVRLGEYNINNKRDCYNYTHYPTFSYCSDPPIDIPIAEKIIYHDYDSESHSQQHDIALLKLRNAVAFTDYIRPICLTSSELSKEFHSGMEKMIVAGWAILNEDRANKDIKQKSMVTLQSYRECSAAYNSIHVSLNDQLCTQGQQSCTCDGGGPLMIHKKTSTGYNWFLVGVFSFGPTPCGHNHWPDVYTNAANYSQWIVSNLK